MRRRTVFSMSLFAVLAIVCIGITAYTASHLDEVSRPVAWGIIGASAVLAVWNLIAMWRSRMQEPRLAVVFSAIIVAALVGLTAVAYAGIGPFSDTDGVAEPTPTPSPIPTPSPEDIRLIRQDGSMRVTIDAACLTLRDSIRIDMTIQNVGNSTLTVARFRHLPLDEAVESPLADPTHPCHDGIPPGQTCIFRYSDDTHLELRPRDLTEETYLVVYSEDATGDEYGVTFTLPPAYQMPGCK